MTTVVQVTEVRSPNLQFLPLAAFKPAESNSSVALYEFTSTFGGFRFASSATDRLKVFGTGLTYGQDGALTGGTVTRVEIIDRSLTSSSLVSLTSYSFSGGAIAFDGLNIGGAAFWSVWTSATTAAGVEALTQSLMPGAVVFVGDSTTPPVSGGFDTYIGFERDDVFAANTGDFADVLIGHLGNDTFLAYGGDDYVNGGAGNDALLAGTGADLVFGEDGHDSVWAGDGNDIALLGSGNDTAFGEGGDDLIFGEAGSDALQGGDGADFVAGGESDDYAWGQAGADYLYGEAGIDTMFGGTGDDVLVGGADGDALYGEDGVDALFGGTGNDYFVGGAGTDFLYVVHDGPVAGELDFVDGFEAAASGTADWMVLPAAYQKATTFFDSAGYAWIATSVAGGTHYVAVSGADAATVQTQTIWA
jgi:Ca2+-binding RTX toxin-like protein